MSGSKRGITVTPVTDEDSLRIIASLANTVWREAYEGIVDRAQTAYMIERFQSYEAIRDQVDNRGYTYLLVRDGPRVAGYCGYVPDDRGLFLSKIYVHRDFRHKGVSSPVFEHLRTVARSLGKSKVYLTVNRGNEAAIRVYEHVGFEIVESADNPIGDGFVMNDYIMEMKV
ncbi:MAG: GNAT family N-acetyltransferase [Thermoplasmata archaeon]|nr:GNAT family N-acetyltransferase [Thermoplasmata archaeon]